MPLQNGLYYCAYEGGNLAEPPVLLLHGAGLDSGFWPAAFRRIPGRRVLAIDLPGHGRSPGTVLHSVAAYAERLLDFLTDQNISSAVFAGHGLGAAIALQLAARRPAHAAGLALLSGGACLNLPAEVVEPFRSPATLPLALARLQERLFSPGVKAEQFGSLIRQLESARPAVMMADWRASAEFDLRSEVYRVSAPVWVACGVDDRLVPLSSARFLAGQLPQARLEIFGQAGYMLPLEQTEKTAAGLRNFLESIRPDYLRVEEQGLQVEDWPQAASQDER